MGTIRIDDSPAPQIGKDHTGLIEVVRQSAKHTNHDLDTSVTETPNYDLEKIQADALLVHARQEISHIFIRTETLLSEVREAKHLIRWAVGGVWLLLAFQLARLAGFSK